MSYDQIRTLEKTENVGGNEKDDEVEIWKSDHGNIFNEYLRTIKTKQGSVTYALSYSYYIPLDGTRRTKRQ